MASDRKGQSWAVLAMSEMGKGVWQKAVFKAAPPDRLIAWDPVGDMGHLCRQVGSFRELLQAIKAPTFRVRYVPRGKKASQLREEFETFCTIAYHAVGATIFVDELADVTSASFAPPAWRILNTRGRHHQGLTLYYHSQSPAWIDKASLGNATHLHVGYLGEPRHRQAAAAHMGCPPEMIEALQQGEYIECVKATKTLTRGRVAIPGVCRAQQPRPLSL